MLSRDLEGYREYRQKVRYRLFLFSRKGDSPNHPIFQVHTLLGPYP